jgi:hypothetical protein
MSVMRLPRSSAHLFFVRFVVITILLAFTTVRPLHAAKQVTGQLASSPYDLRFGEVTVGQTETQELVLTNTGETTATISSISVSGAEFTVSPVNLPVTLASGQSVALTVTFAPAASGWEGGKITVSSTAENATLAIVIAGTGVTSQALTATPSSLAFGQVSMGSSATNPVVIVNSSSSSVTISGVQAVGGGFSINAPPASMTLASGQSMTLSVTFTPQSAGVASGSIFLVGPRLNIPITGTGFTIGQLTVSPATLSFGNVAVGSQTTQPSSITATGGSVTISSDSSSNSQFSITGLSLPVTLNSGQSVAFDVVFAPSQTGSQSSTLSFASNASSQGSESLSGTGTQQQYSVGLTWDASTSQVAGYNVYRGTAPGAYSKINTALNATTAYTDSTVSSGVTYYYAATSVTSSGQESGYSTPVQVSVP